MSLSDKECNVLVNKIDTDKFYHVTICPNCKKQTTSLMENTACHDCSEKDPCEDKWIKRVNFITIPIKGKESLGFMKGFLIEDVKDSIEKIKKRMNEESEELGGNYPETYDLKEAIGKIIDEEVGPKLTNIKENKMKFTINELFGVPIERWKELMDLFMEAGYNLKDYNCLKLIKRDYFHKVELEE